ncbi:translation initiation factor IF-2-like [Falco naumanni]|uniref:translation initiation factor IF-2-like n=1 Tax=Falco naumanni TaxID=148594 RepID=UPI001ADE976F|nr:translation initiation factor IF-2-like [Falco naumanni]
MVNTAGVTTDLQRSPWRKLLVAQEQRDAGTTPPAFQLHCLHPNKALCGAMPSCTWGLIHDYCLQKKHLNTVTAQHLRFGFSSVRSWRTSSSEPGRVAAPGSAGAARPAARERRTELSARVTRAPPRTRAARAGSAGSEPRRPAPAGQPSGQVPAPPPAPPPYLEAAQQPPPRRARPASLFAWGRPRRGACRAQPSGTASRWGGRAAAPAIARCAAEAAGPRRSLAAALARAPAPEPARPARPRPRRPAAPGRAAGARAPLPFLPLSR